MSKNQIFAFEGKEFKVPAKKLVQVFNGGVTISVLEQSQSGPHKITDPTGKEKRYEVKDSAQRTFSCGTPFAEGSRHRPALEIESNAVLSMFKEQGIKPIRRERREPKAA